MAERKLSAQERAGLFAQATRQNLQMLPSQSTQTGASTLQFTLPKSRLLSKIYLNVEATIKATHASSTSVTIPTFAPYTLLRRVSVDLNNGFSPFVVGGRELAMYNMLRLNPDIVLPQSADSRRMCYISAGTASTTGAENKIKFTLELPITLNERDMVGLIMLQNEASQVNVTVDIANAGDVYNNPNGYTFELTSCVVTPATETFTIPAIREAFPDISVLKLVSSRSETFAGGGQNIVKLNVGTIYRKLIMYVEDGNGQPFEDADFTSNIEMLFNQADIPYSIKSTLLAHRNQSQLGFALPKGMYAFDLTNQGIPNLGGSRDYIDTEKLTEFWIRFSSTKAGKVTIISENLARLLQ